MNYEKLEKKIYIYIKVLLAALIVFIPFRNILELVLGTYVKILPDIAILILFLLYVILKKDKISIKLYDIFIVIFLGVGFINTVIIQKISLFIYIFEVRSIMIYYILYFVIRNFKYDNKYRIQLTKLIRYVTYVLFILGVIEKISNKTIAFPKSIAESIIYASNYVRVHSMFFNPNTYGAFLVISFFTVMYLEKNSKEMILYKIVVYTSLLLSMSRSSLLIFVAGLVVYIFVFRKEIKLNRKIIVKIILIFLTSFILYGICEKTTDIVSKYRGNENTSSIDISTTVFDRMNELRGEQIINNSKADGRLYFIKTGLMIFCDYPVLGTGFGTFGSAASMNWKPPMYEKYGLRYGFYADNGYIKNLVETGIIGVGLLLAFCISILFAYKKKWFCVFLCIIIGWFGLFYNVLEVQIVAFLFWSILGILFMDKNGKGKDNN